MRPIGDYTSMIAARDFTRYIASDPPAVLLHKVPAGVLQLKSSYLATILGELDSAALGPALADCDESPPTEVSHLVVELRSVRWPDAARLLIGAAEHADIRVPSPSIAQEHGYVHRRGARYTILAVDEESSIWVGHSKVRPGKERMLQTGDQVRLGMLDFTFLDAVGFYHFVRQVSG